MSEEISSPTSYELLRNRAVPKVLGPIKVRQAKTIRLEEKTRHSEVVEEAGAARQPVAILGSPVRKTYVSVKLCSEGVRGECEWEGGFRLGLTVAGNL